MSRRMRFAALLLLVSFAVGATACADMTGPRGDCSSTQGSETCA